MGRKICYSKAEAAALSVKNMKVEKLNAFYSYHKEIIDEFTRLQDDVQKAQSDLTTATINTIKTKFPPKR